MGRKEGKSSILAGGSGHSTGEFMEEKSSEYRKKLQNKIKLVIFLVLIGDRSRYLCSKTAEQLPNEITHRRRIQTLPVLTEL
jgi:hypothetical protein